MHQRGSKLKHVLYKWITCGPTSHDAQLEARFYYSKSGQHTPRIAVSLLGAPAHSHSLYHFLHVFFSPLLSNVSPPRQLSVSVSPFLPLSFTVYLSLFFCICLFVSVSVSVPVSLHLCLSLTLKNPDSTPSSSIDRHIGLLAYIRSLFGLSHNTPIEILVLS